jgi:hypothetical protein
VFGSYLCVLGDLLSERGLELPLRVVVDDRALGAVPREEVVADEEVEVVLENVLSNTQKG